jgi:hypothetical protein
MELLRRKTEVRRTNRVTYFFEWPEESFRVATENHNDRVELALAFSEYVNEPLLVPRPFSPSLVVS